MKLKKAAVLAVATALVLTITGCSWNTAEPAQAAAPVQEEKPAAVLNEHRVVATTVSVTEIMDALGIDLVGVPTSYKKLPERYAGVPEVGNPMSPDMEKVMSLKPTEVLSVTTLKYDLAPKFTEAGVEAHFLDLKSLDDMEQAIVSLGEKYGKATEAAAIVDRFNGKVSEIKKANEGKPSPKVLILLGVPGSYLVATEKSYIGDLVKICGGTNVIQDAKVEYLASNTEYLHQANPDIILRAAHGMPKEVVEMFDKEFKENDIWKHFNAVNNNRVYDLDELLFGTTGNLAAVEALNELQTMLMLYP